MQAVPVLVPQQTHVVRFGLSCIDAGGAPGARVRAVLARDPLALDGSAGALVRPVLSVLVTMPVGLSVDEVRALEG